MIINDIIHGRVEITEPVIADLINSKKFQRLKDIAQQGVPEQYIMPTQIPFPRYDHCIGTMLVVRKLNATLEEQIASLLHDISHTAFSHLADAILGSAEREDFQDKNHHLYFDEGTELATILEKYGLDPKRISVPENFSLLEQEQPDICADRIDYTTRYWAHKGPAELDFAKRTINSLVVRNGVMLFNNGDIAKEFAQRHMVWQPEWNGYGGEQYDMSMRWFLFAGALKRAMNEGLVKKEDFYETDTFVLDKLKKSKDPKVVAVFKLLGTKRRLKYSVGGTNAITTIFRKFRYVDPKYIGEDGKIHKVSDNDDAFNKDIEDHRKLNREGVRINGIEGIDVSDYV